jgi:hypothetical protein
MKKILLLVLLLPGLCLAGSYSIAITNDGKVSKFFTGRPGPWLMTIRTREADTAVTCNGAPCPDQINEDQTINFTVTSASKTQNIGFDIEFTSNPFVLADDICFHKETYYITSGDTPAANDRIVISDEPPKGGTHDATSDCSPYLQKKGN